MFRHNMNSEMNEDNTTHEIVDPLMPIGSKRRGTLKVICTCSSQ